MLKYEFDPEIMKSGDIRGVFNKELFVRDAYFVGRSFGTRLAKLGYSQCIIGRDGRLSSAELKAELEKGLQDSGIDVTDLGLIPSPVLYYAVSQHPSQSGVMITASHNPAEYNGFKFLTEKGPFHGSDIHSLSEICRAGDYAVGTGSAIERDVVPEYIDYIISFLKPARTKDISVVWDPGNGAMAAVIDRFIERLPWKNRVICGEVDGNFPNHHPDPTIEENVSMLREAVEDSKADLGIAFDGDGDRLGVVDGEGYLLGGDQLLTIFARDFLIENPGESVMSEVKASQFFSDDVLANGGRPVIWKVGHSNQKEKMRKEGIRLAGETSGHIYFAENGNLDDALFASVKLLNILARSPKSLTDMRKGFPLFKDSGEIRVALDTEVRMRVLEEIERRLVADGRAFDSIDGVRVPCGDGFWIMRCSNTQPHITIRSEATSNEGLKACLEDMRIQLALSGINDMI